jgi:hypothetical protein
MPTFDRFDRFLPVAPPKHVERLPDELLDAIEERAAILEFDAGMNRREAERLASLMIDHRRISK